jgi:hypothetical protein
MLSRLSLIPFIALALTLTGCRNSSENGQAAHQSHSASRPLVAIVPVINNTKSDEYAWSLSDEFTSSIFSCLAQGPLYLDHLGKVREMVKKCKEMQNPFGTNTSWIKKAFENEQFVVFLELVEHEEILKRDRRIEIEIDPKTCPADLKLCMRIRAFDLRGEVPRVILQELVNNSHFIPKQFTKVNFQQVAWGDENFNFSPLGLAHWEFAKEIATRIEDYIRIAIPMQQR